MCNRGVSHMDEWLLYIPMEGNKVRKQHGVGRGNINSFLLTVSGLASSNKETMCLSIRFPETCLSYTACCPSVHIMPLLIRSISLACPSCKAHH